jgi:uncharacterized protein involved in exopolysaccharide biosynthesis
MVDSGGESGLMGLLQGADFPAISSLNAFGGKQPGQAYADIVQSRTLLTRLLTLRRQGNSSEQYFAAFAPKSGSPAKRIEKAVKRLRSSIETDFNARTGMLTIKVESDNPGLSSEVANQLSEQLRLFDSITRRSQASDAATFIGARLAEAAANLSKAEAAQARFREANARIGNAPLLLLEDKRLTRQVELNEQIHALLTREYEMARIQEKKDTPVFTVVDSAIPPVRPAGLHPLIVAALAAGMASLAALFIAVAYSLRRA